MYIRVFVPIESLFSITTISKPVIVPPASPSHLWPASTASHPPQRGPRTAAGRGLLLRGGKGWENAADMAMYNGDFYGNNQVYIL